MIDTNKKSLSGFARSREARQKGFTVAEILISLSILSFGIILVYSAFSNIVAVTNNIQSRFAAAYLAQEGLEIVRNLRDNNFIAKSQGADVAWVLGLADSPCNTGCMVDYTTRTAAQLIPWDDSYLGIDDQGFYGYGQDLPPTIFKRKIVVVPLLGLEDESMNVSVVVSWDYNGASHSFKINENLYDWY